MPNTECQRSVLRSESTRHEYDVKNRIVCNCGWELRLGYGIAVSLAIFEAKRFFLLALEIFVEWQVIRFAGGYRPVVLTFIDITLGFPCALAAVYTIRKRQIRPSYSKSRKVFVYLLLTVTTCAILNILTMASIGYNVSVRQRAIASVFNDSMYLYVTTESYKYTIDQIQFVLQCCGYTSYADWFLFDWQLVDYASRDEMSRQTRISDEIYRDRGVPFSCCNLRVLGPCVHSQMIEEDTKTINVDGCSGILSNFLVRTVFVAYAMTTMLVLTQALLAFFIARIAKRTISKEFSRKITSTKFSNGSPCPLVESLVSSEDYCRRNYDYSVQAWKYTKGSGKKKSIGGINKGVGSGAVVSGFSDISQDMTSSETSCVNETRYKTARIKPSIHIEHRVPKKKPAIKRIR